MEKLMEKVKPYLLIVGMVMLLIIKYIVKAPTSDMWVLLLIYFAVEDYERYKETGSNWCKYWYRICLILAVGNIAMFVEEVLNV